MVCCTRVALLPGLLPVRLSRHTCWGDILVAPPGLLIIVSWTKTLQCVGKTPIPPIPAVSGHLEDPLAADRELLMTSPTTTPNQPLLIVTKGITVLPITVAILARALAVMVHSLGLDTSLYSLHSPRRGGATTAYGAGKDQLDIKRHVGQQGRLLLYHDPLCFHLSSGHGIGRHHSSHSVAAAVHASGYRYWSYITY